MEAIDIFNIIHNLPNKSYDTFGVHTMDFEINTISYKVYHCEGYCFEVSETNEKEGVFSYHFHEGMYKGFKEIDIKEAYSLIKEGTPFLDFRICELKSELNTPFQNDLFYNKIYSKIEEIQYLKSLSININN